MLRVDIHIISTTNPDMEPIRTSQHTPIGVVYLGLTAQFHYQILEKIVHHPTLEVINDYQLTSDANSPKGVSQALTEDYEKEDEEAFNYQAQLRGLPYDREKSRQHLFRCSWGRSQTYWYPYR